MNPVEFLPVSQLDMAKRGWEDYEILLITGDAYVDHPSFGTPVIGRLLESAGYRVAILAQPDWHDAEAIRAMGRPKLCCMLSAGNLDSMVAHYTAAKRLRGEDFYSPGKKAGLRPDRAVIVYAGRVREAFPGLPVIVGGLEASLRRFAHYDYWDDKVRRSVLVDSGADLLTYGMGERASLEIARRLKAGERAEALTDIRGTACLRKERACAYDFLELPSFEEVREDKRAYAEACRVENQEHDAIRGRALLQKHGERWLVVNPPAAPLETAELDALAALPFTREPHPMYDALGGVPAIEEVRFSIIHNRGCFGGCNFCSLAFHQGRYVTSRSHESVVAEAEAMTRHPLFKGYIHDVGGPTANFRHPSCLKQKKLGLCPDRSCLSPKACPNLDADHSDYIALLRKLRAIPGVKKVFVRSGIRFDYVLAEKKDDFLRELTKYHVSGQLKVAPEHCIDQVLDKMGKPRAEVFEAFCQKYEAMNSALKKQQYLVPYLMSSHPGSTLGDAVKLALYLKKRGVRPRQVQDFYPTPGTVSTCMYYTGLDPYTMEKVYVPRSYREKELQRSLLQWFDPSKKALVLEALQKAHREDLIGYGPDRLVSPEKPGGEARHFGDGKGGISGEKKQGSPRPAGRPAGSRKKLEEAEKKETVRHYGDGKSGAARKKQPAEAPPPAARRTGPRKGPGKK